MSLINLPGHVSKIWKSALFEMSLRRCMRCLKYASEMHPCRLVTYPLCEFNKFFIGVEALWSPFKPYIGQLSCSHIDDDLNPIIKTSRILCFFSVFSSFEFAILFQNFYIKNHKLQLWIWVTRFSFSSCTELVLWNLTQFTGKH